MKKVIVSLLWVVFLNGALAMLFAEFSVNFNPTITHEESYEYGNTYGAYFFLFSVALIVYLAVTNRLPGARQRTSS
ncbi:hypothetical protein GJ700_00595 [Duganella sp. FT92W]|uniref:Uncharacterized protein n=1 Tax=Pseudoduganella rivuli TaxID=2666085 RepID=A0A7X2IHP4_9BURK|nr:hypothetical protein [Pseudoduganella rivuli]MRV70219.1 hypothetical protein [Pseudoduganella rivuli]